MELLNLLKKHYNHNFDHLELLRDAGSTSYVVFAKNNRYFLRVIKSAFLDTAVIGADIQVYLQELGFPVPPIIFTKDGLPYVKTNDLLILYEYIEGSEPDLEQDAEDIGALVGRFHHVMKGCPIELVKRDKYFFIDRYIDILRKKQYPKADAFQAYGNTLWEKIKDFPRGYCHGDMYSGNIYKTPNRQFYLLDFDSSCEGFSMYDPALICNRTQYFDFDESGYEESKRIFSRFMSEYLKNNTLSQAEVDAFCDFIALYHFALQATIIEIHGINCVDHTFLDKQLDWLYRWREQYLFIR